LFFKIIGTFVKYYIIDGAWKHWKAGLIMVMQFSFFTFNIWAKQWELENEITLESIEAKYDNIRNKILKDINK
jgi:hypothetical protein